MFVGVFQAIRGVKNDLDQKMSFVGVHPLMKSGQKGASQGEPLGINFFGLSMHFPHQLGKRDGKINWLCRSDLFGAFWATLTTHVCNQFHLSILQKLLIEKYYEFTQQINQTTFEQSYINLDYH